MKWTRSARSLSGPSGRPNPGLRTTLTVLVAVIMPVVGLLWAAGVSQGEVRRSALAGLSATAQATVRQEQQAWNDAVAAVTLTASRSTFQQALAGGDAAPAQLAVDGLLLGGPFADARAFDASGSLVASAATSGITATAIGPPSTPPEAGPLVSEGTQTLRQVSAPVSAAGTPLGRLVVDVNLTSILGDPAALSFGRTGTKLLVTPDGMVVAGSASVGAPLLAAENRTLVAAQRPATSQVYSVFYHRDSVEAVQPIPGQPLEILVQQAASEALAGANALAAKLRWAAAILGLLGVCLAVILGVLAARRSRRLEGSERALAEARGAERRRLGQFLDAMPLGVFVSTPDGRPAYANREAQRLLGRGVVPEATAEDLAQVYQAYVAGTQTLYPTERMPQFQAMGGVAAHVEDVEIRRPDATVAIEAWGTPVLDKDGALEFAIAAFADITERRRSTEELQLLGAITANMAEGVMVVKSADGRIAYANASLEAMFGYQPGEMLDLSVSVLSPTDNAAATPMVEAVLAGGAWQGERRQVRKDGSQFWSSMHLSTFEHHGLGPVWIGVQTDITARRRLEDEQRRWASIVQASTDAILGKDLQGLVTSWNPGAERLFGYRADEMVGRHIEDLIPPGGRVEERMIRAQAAGGIGIDQYETTRLRKDGTSVAVSVTISPIPDAGGTVVGIASVCRDITDQKRSEAQLRRGEEELAAARDQALEASRLKSQFLATMSHEIRTPMNAVLGMTHLLLGSDLQAEQRRHALSLRSAGQNLLAIINDILDFSKVEAGKLELECVPFDLRTAVESVVGLLASPAIDKGLDLVLAMAPSVPGWVQGDSVRLRQVLINLLGNAVKFTEAGSVSLRVTVAEQGRLRFEVADTGIGIGPDAREHLLDPFSQADSSTTRRFGGTGLGLAICRQLVDLMGGDLDFDSEPGRGSTFWFEADLPAAEPTSDSLHAAPAAGQAERGLPLGPVAPGTRVLLADDAELNREVGVGLLTRMGFGVDIATNGIEAVEAVQRSSFYAVLMDCLMPVMDGFEATAHIRRLDAERGHHTPIIALTASAMHGDRERCLAAGMDDYVSKPLDPSSLAAALGRCRPGSRSAAAPPMPGDSRAATEAEVTQALGELREMISPEAFNQVVTMFLTRMPEMAHEIQEAASAADLALLKSLVHRFKGNLSGIGAPTLATIAGAIETTADVRPGDVAGLVGQLLAELDRVRAVVATFLPGGELVVRR